MRTTAPTSSVSRTKRSGSTSANSGGSSRRRRWTHRPDHPWYCFQLNGALAGLLTAVGYEATLHVAGVHGDAGAAAAMGNHAAVVVHSLPTEANPDGRWYVDAGLGDVLHEPLPLRAWRGSDAHASYELAPVSDGVGHWRLGARSAGGVAAVTMDARPTAIGAFRARHLFNATSGESSFARTVTAQRRHATGTDVLRGCVLTRRDGTRVERDVHVVRRVAGRPRRRVRHAPRRRPPGPRRPVGTRAGQPQEWLATSPAAA